MKGKNFNRVVAVAVEGIDFLHLLRVQFDCDHADNDFWLYNFFEDRSQGSTVQGDPLDRWLLNFCKQAREVQDFAVRTLAIIRDAEDSKQGQFETVCHALERVGMPVPAANGMFASGTWENFAMKVGVLIIPNDANSGCLETCLLRAPKQEYALEPAHNFQAAAELAARAVPALKAKVEGKTPHGLSRWREKVVVRAMISADPDDPGQTLSASGTWLWDFNRAPLKDMIDFINAARSAGV